MAWVKQRVTDDGDKRCVACYRDPEGRQRSAGTYSSNRAAERAGNREEASLRRRLARPLPGRGHLRAIRRDRWLPSKHVETSTKAAYRSNLDKHFIPFFGRRPMGKITPRPKSRTGSPPPPTRPVAAVGPQVPHHAASIFERAVRDELISPNPCAHTELPKGHRHEDPHPDPGRVRRSSSPRSPTGTG